jgi:hypothetical protein
MASPGVFDSYVRVRPANGMTEFTVLEIPVAASQSIAINDIVAISSGKLSQAIAAPAAGQTTLSGGNLPIVGVALAPIVTDATGTETAGGQSRTTTPVAIFDDRLNVLLRGATTNGASQTLANYTLGTAYQIGRFTNAAGTASWYFLSPTTTNGEIKFVEIPFDYRSDTTTKYPLLWGKAVLSATVRQFA